MGSLYGLGWALGGLGVAHHNLGNFQKAEEYYTRAFEVRRDLGDKRGAAWCLNSLGWLNDTQGKYRQALAYEHEAMAIYEALGDRRGIGTVLYSFGSVYYYLGDFSKSMEHFEDAYAIAMEEEDVDLLQRTASGMGSVYQAAGRPDLAEKSYLEHLENVRNSGDLTGIIWAINNIASVYVQTGKLNEARPLVEEALTLLPDTGMDYLRARTMFLLGKTVDSNAEAIVHTEQALELAEAGGIGELTWRYLSELGDYYLLEGDVEKSKRLQERAIQEIESIRRGVGSDELRRHMMRPTIRPYNRVVSLIVDSARDEADVREAYGYVERSKAQIFTTLLREALSRIELEVGQSESAERDLVSQLSQIQSRLQDGGLEETEKEKLLANMQRIERDLLQQEIQLAGQQQDYAAAVYPVHVEVSDLLATLEPSERMLSYFLGKERSYLFASKGAEISVFVLPGRVTIEEKAGFYIRVLRQLAGEARGTAADGGGASLPAEVLDNASGELHDMLVGPAAEFIDPSETLVIIPDGILNRLPFALLRNDGVPLIEKHDIYYAPSLQALYYLRKRGGERSSAAPDDRVDVIALGSSGVPAGRRETTRVYPFTDIAVVPLPRAAEEARAVAGMFPRSAYLVGDDARERPFKSAELERADILHIAAHSYVDNEDARRSFIVLTPDEKAGGKTEEQGSNRVEDGLLQWQEIAGLRLDASLVTLSACRAAGGVLAVGEGITGLTQAFLYAGGDCVLASFIDVPDRFAGRFMSAFYGNLKAGLSGAAALRAAQLEAMNWDDIAHGPALWGSFALIGDGNFVVAPR
jgi:CHAT domain-containing protein/Tfp pilus assembly protein PilF